MDSIGIWDTLRINKSGNCGIDITSKTNGLNIIINVMYIRKNIADNVVNEDKNIVFLFFSKIFFKINRIERKFIDFWYSTFFTKYILKSIINFD